MFPADTPDPFSKESIDMAQEVVRAPHRIIDEEKGEVVYGPGDVMTPEDVEKYNVNADSEETPDMPRQNYVAPHRIIDDEKGEVVYGPGDAMTAEDAVKYGVIDEAELEAQQKAEEPDRSTLEVNAARERARQAAANRQALQGPNRSGGGIDPSVLEPERSNGEDLKTHLENEAKASEPAPEPEDDSPKPPAKSATKATWVAYAETQGLSHEDADALTIPELVERFGG